MQNQRGFIQIPLLIIVIASIVVASVGTGAVLHGQGKLVSLTADISELFKGNERIAIIEKDEAKPKEPQVKQGLKEIQDKVDQLEPRSPLVLEIDPCAGIVCSNCQYCIDGNCIVRPDGYSDCGSGCQRCVNGSCRDYNDVCPNCQYCSSDNCINYCQETDTSCGCANCVNCNDSDNWVDIGSTYSCCEENKACICQQQEYRDYSCSGTSCTFSVTNTRVNKDNCTNCNSCQYCSEGACYNYCQRTDANCGCISCTNCNASDGCSGSIYLDYHCKDTFCSYSIDNCSDCSCSCGGYNVKESLTNKNCSDGKDNDCDGAVDLEDSQCQEFINRIETLKENRIILPEISAQIEKEKRFREEISLYKEPLKLIVDYFSPQMYSSEIDRLPDNYGTEYGEILQEFINRIGTLKEAKRLLDNLSSSSDMPEIIALQNNLLDAIYYFLDFEELLKMMFETSSPWRPFENQAVRDISKGEEHLKRAIDSVLAVGCEQFFTGGSKKNRIKRIQIILKYIEDGGTYCFPF